MGRIAIIASHPVQYYAPWFKYLATIGDLNIRVFYLWDFGVNAKKDKGFQLAIKWDTPLLDGYNYEFVPNTSSHAGTDSFWGLQNPSLFRRVEQYKPSAVLLLNYNYSSLISFLLRWNKKQVPVIFRGDSHRLLVNKSVTAQIRKKVTSYLFRRISGFLYVGQSNYEYFIYHNVKPENLFYSPHSVDNDRFINCSEAANNDARTWRKELGIPEDHLVILFSGKYELKKRPIDLLRAYLNLHLKGVTLLFVGSGILEKELRALAGGNSCVKFAPFQNQSLMPRTYAAADLFVLPSYGCKETWGLAVNEAMCMSKPIIVSSHVGCAKDLVHPNENGLIFPAGDISALTKSLIEALSQRERLKVWGLRSLEIIRCYSYKEATSGLKKALEHFRP